MKIIVFSDSHGNRNKVLTMLDEEKDADFCFFLGDGLREAEEMAKLFPEIKFIMVRGNNDFYTQKDNIAYKHIDGLTFVACHGDNFHVREGLYDLFEHAKGVRADIALYGHTHLRNQYEDIRTGVYAINPGALCGGCYAVITTNKGKFEVKEKII